MNKKVAFERQGYGVYSLFGLISLFRCAGYQAEIFNYCDKENILFTISGRKDKSVWASINTFRMIVVKKI